MKIYTIYDVPSHEGITFELPTETQQQFIEDCDINNIINRFTKTGLLPQHPVGDFLDVSNYPSYQDALNLVIDADSRFMELPAYIRKEFDNDPSKFVEFVDNPDNFERGVALGIFSPKEISLEPPVSEESGVTQESQEQKQSDS